MRAFILALVAFVTTLVPLSATAQQAPLETSSEPLVWAEQQLDGYYETLFALSGVDYVSPVVEIIAEGGEYRGACGVYSGNSLAFYCPLDGHIVLSDPLMDELHEVDETVPMYVLAHEWAHHAQHLSGTQPVYLPTDGDWDLVYTIENELRADCLAGAWFGNIESRDYLNATDMSAVLITASKVGDAGLMGRGRSHGTGVERLRAVLIGYENGPLGCMAITPLERLGNPVVSTPGPH